MERCCKKIHGELLKKADFAIEDKIAYLDINYYKLVSNIVGKEKCIDNSVLLNRDILAYYFDKVIYSVACQRDIMNEIYLSLLYADGKQEPLYQKSSVSVKIDREKKSFKSKNPCDALNQSIRTTLNNFNNLKRKKPQVVQLFLLPDKSTKETEIGSFGSGVKRLWLSSKEFRNLFTATRIRYEKYSLEKIKHFVDYEINYKEEDYLILEKLVGANSMYLFKEFIINNIGRQFDDELKGILIKLINVLTECPGINSRNLFIMYIGCDLLSIKSTNISATKRLNEYVKLLNNVMPCFVKLYDEMYNTIIDFYMKNYSYTSVKEIVESKRQLLQMIEYSEMMKSQIYQSYVEKEDAKLAKRLDKEIKQDKKIKMIQDNKMKEQYFARYFYEDIFWRKGFVYEYGSSEILEVLESYVIQNSILRYSFNKEDGEKERT